MPIKASHSRRASLVDIAYESILEAIVDQQLAPGSRINMDSLAADIEMSNTPIREALARLTATGLVKQISNRGFIVSPILSELEYHHLFDTRCLLETNALKIAQFSNDTLDALDIIANKISDMDYGMTYKRFIGNLEADESFHLHLILASQNRFMLDAWQSLNFYPHVSRLHTQEEAFEKGRYKSSLAEHTEIVDLLRANKREDAVECLRSHIRSVEQRLLQSAIKLSQHDTQDA